MFLFNVIMSMSFRHDVTQLWNSGYRPNASNALRVYSKHTKIIFNNIPEQERKTEPSAQREVEWLVERVRRGVHRRVVLARVQSLPH